MRIALRCHFIRANILGDHLIHRSAVACSIYVGTRPRWTAFAEAVFCPGLSSCSWVNRQTVARPADCAGAVSPTDWLIGH